jgi:hypothetical protein
LVDQTGAVGVGTGAVVETSKDASAKIGEGDASVQQVAGMAMQKGHAEIKTVVKEVKEGVSSVAS